MLETSAWAPAQDIQPLEAGASLVERYVLPPAQQVWSQVVAYAPTVLSAAFVLLALWIVARIVRAIVARVLGMTRLDAAIAETWMQRALSSFGEGFTPSAALAAIAYYSILLLAWAAAADIVGLTAVKVALSSVLDYVPRLASALLVLAAGGYAASAARRAVHSVMKQLKSPYGGIVEFLTEGTLLVIVVSVAVDMLGVDLSFVTANLALLVGAIVVTICFLLAWSMRRPAEEIIANYYLRRLVSVGDHLELAGAAGRVEKFAPLGVVVSEADGTQRFIPAHHVLEGLRKSAGAGDPAAG